LSLSPFLAKFRRPPTKASIDRQYIFLQNKPIFPPGPTTVGRPRAQSTNRLIAANCGIIPCAKWPQTGNPAEATVAR
jgi:hypothetical protein